MQGDRIKGGEVGRTRVKFFFSGDQNSKVNDFVSNTMSMSLGKRNQKTSSGSRKTSRTAKTRLLRLKASTESSQDHVDGSGQYSEAGFMDVRTNYEKDRLLQWVWI